MAHLLIVDDESNIRMMMRLSLQAVGHQVQTAADGSEGLERFGDGAGWDLVLLDQRMPGMDGLAVLREMRRRRPAARIIMITAFGTIDLAKDAAQAGATGFLRKPFTMDTLRGAVQAALGGTATPGEPASPALPAPPFGVTSINGYRIMAEAEPPGGATAAPSSGEVRHRFVVLGHDGSRRHCTVLLPVYVVELVKAHADCEKMPHGDDFWRWMCEEALANYLWQQAELPASGTLRIDELTTSLRRWVDAVAG